MYSEYYGEVSDYTHKGGVVCTDILLPPQAPNQYQDRATLWNAVEKAERGKKAQLAYSFDIALQNEFSLEENIALARQFVSEQLVGRGMIADFAIHQPDKEDGGIPNPHFHVLCPIRPIEPDGKWGCKQRRRYRLDEDGNRIMGEDGKPLFDAVPTTDWGSPETLEHWREAWAAMVNAKFEEKGLTCRIDHRSYERQGLDLLPTVHEGVAVRQMEAKGIPTDKGDLNRWIKKANNILRDIRKKIAGLTDWILGVRFGSSYTCLLYTSTATPTHGLPPPWVIFLKGRSTWGARCWARLSVRTTRLKAPAGQCQRNNLYLREPSPPSLTKKRGTMFSVCGKPSAGHPSGVMPLTV